MGRSVTKGVRNRRIACRDEMVVYVTVTERACDMMGKTTTSS